MNNYSIANADAGINRHIRIQLAVASKHRTRSCYASRPDSSVVADPYILAEHHVSAYTDVLTQPN